MARERAWRIVHGAGGFENWSVEPLAEVGGSAAKASSCVGLASSSASAEVAMQRVTGIGGLFFRAQDPGSLSAWYQKYLGIDLAPTEYGQTPWSQAAGPTVFAPFPQDSDYFGTAAKQWMVNFRVNNLDAMVSQLRAASIEVAVDQQNYPNGRFARLHDPEGNPIELWEPK